MAKEDLELNSGCQTELHDQHLCYIISQGFHLSDKQEYKARSKMRSISVIIVAVQQKVMLISVFQLTCEVQWVVGPPTLIITPMWNDHCQIKGPGYRFFGQGEEANNLF